MTTILAEAVYPLDQPIKIEIKPQLGGRTRVDINEHTYNFWNEECYLHCDGNNLGLIIAKDKSGESWIKTKLKSLLKKGTDNG